MANYLRAGIMAAPEFLRGEKWTEMLALEKEQLEAVPRDLTRNKLYNKHMYPYNICYTSIKNKFF